jgi:EAL domain-containing protein (putative c-di-GMP-specific phosphodiesterase class I)
MTANPDDATIVIATIVMGKNLKQGVIAEGVETREQLAFLQSQHCAEGQGNLSVTPWPPPHSPIYFRWAYQKHFYSGRNPLRP